MIHLFVAKQRFIIVFFSVAMAALFVFSLGSVGVFSAEASPTAPIIVNRPLDLPDPTPDGICDIDPSTPALECTFRAAVQEANFTPGHDDIIFSIPSGGATVFTITIDATLPPFPSLTDAAGVTIDAVSAQAGAACAATASDTHTLKIVLDGAMLGGPFSGLTFAPPATGNLIRGLSIINFPEHGIALLGGSGNLIACNHIGVGVDGSTAFGNRRNGIFIADSGHNSIGGSIPGDRNVISANRENGLLLVGGATTGNLVEGNRIGTIADGTAMLGNGQHGIALVGGATSNTIGGDSSSGLPSGCTDFCNLISGNRVHGIFADAGADSNRITSNFIGTNNGGDSAIPNLENGIYLQAVSDTVIGTPLTTTRNLISGNGGNGIAIATLITSPVTATENTIIDNYIGVAADGSTSLPNSGNGIFAVAADGTVIVGNRINDNGKNGILLEAGAESQIFENIVKANLASGVSLLNHSDAAIGRNGQGNLIHSNIAHGIVISGSASTQNLVVANWIGLQADGVTAAGNGVDGVLLVNARQTYVGSSIWVSAENDFANVIVANGGSGIHITDSDATLNIIDHNFIGTNISGTLTLGNTDYGVLIENGAHGNAIGLVFGALRGLGGLSTNSNTITNNGKDGIAILGSSSTENSILNNLIYANGELGIDLADDGVTANDADDSDSGANKLQNYPTLTAGSLSTILVELTSTASTTYTINMFTSDDCDPSGYGEGQVWQEKFSLIMPSGGTISQTYTFSNTLAGKYATATATDATGNTSEFSACAQITDAVIVNSADDANDGSCNAAHCSLREAMEAINAGAGDTIEFDIAGAGPHLIQPTTALPEVTQPVMIDGTSQTGTTCPTATTAATLMIELDGSMASGGDGLLLSGGNSVIQGLAIYNFPSRGINMYANGGNVIRCNHIGSDGSGVTDGLGNGHDGIFLSSINDNVVGGSADADRNVIVNSASLSASNVPGIRIKNGTDNRVMGNYIGVDASGNNAMGNEAAGVRLNNATAMISNNVIGDNGGHGIEIVFDSSATIQGNHIGVGKDGTTALGNNGDGIHVWNSSNSYIGTSPFVARAAADGNIIAYNNDNGVVIRSSGGITATHNLIGGNSIFSNTNRGIDLGDDGVTVNDADDVDTGANDLVNYPQVATAIDQGSTLSVTFTLDMVGGGDYIVEFFSNASCDGTHGEGKTFLEARTVSADVNGDLTTTLSISPTTTAGNFLTATTTDPNGSTSEFSACVEVTDPPTPTAVGLGERHVAETTSLLSVLLVTIILTLLLISKVTIATPND